MHAFYNAADAETLSFSMRYAGAPFSVGGAQPTGAADDPTVSATVDIDATAELATCA